MKKFFILLGCTVVFFLVLNVVKLPDRIAKGVFGYEGTVPMFSLDLDPGADAEKSYAILDSYGVRGRKAYVFTLVSFDLVFPVLYGTFLATSIQIFSGRTGWARRHGTGLAMVPYAAMAADLLENVVILAMIFSYPQSLPALAEIRRILTFAKFSLSGASLGAIFL